MKQKNWLRSAVNRHTASSSRELSAYSVSESTCEFVDNSVPRVTVWHHEACHEKTGFCLGKNKGADQLRITAKLISAYVFATQIVQSLFFLKPEFQCSSLQL